MQVVDVNGNMFGYDFLEIIGIDGKPKTIGGSGPFVPYTGAIGNVDLGEYELKAGQLELDQTPTGTAGVAVMRWNDQDGTADLGLKGGNVTLQVGQEQVTRVVNKTGADLLEANYQAVRISGAQGNRLKVDLAQANNDANSADTIGIVTETINNNQEGFVTTSGLVRNINTTGSLQSETWLDGNVLYLSGTIAGQITNVKPSAPIHTVIMGYVVRAHATQGQIYVKVDNGYELDELHNVAITTPLNDQVLQYETATSLWKNKTIASGITIGTTAITSGTVGRVLFEGTGNIVQESASLTFDGTKLVVGVSGNAIPNATQILRVVNNVNGADAEINGNGYARIFFNDYSRGSNLKYYEMLNYLSDFKISRLNDANNTRTERLTIFGATGNVNIGTTNPTDAGFKLDVNGTFRAQANTTILGTTIPLSITGNGTSAFSMNSGNDVYFSFNSQSAVGRFYANPQNTVQNTYDRPTSVGFVGTLAGSDVWYGNMHPNGGAVKYNSSENGASHSHIWYYNFTERMRLISSGNLLIGTSTDAGYRLDVNGTARVQGVITGTIPSGSLTLGAAAANQVGISVTGYFGTGAISTSNSNGRSFNTFIGGQNQGLIVNYNSVAQGQTIDNHYFIASGNINLLDGAINLNGFSFRPTIVSEVGATIKAFSSNLSAASNRWNLYLSGTAKNYIEGNLLIGTTTDVASSLLTMSSTTKGFLPPRMTTTEKNAIATPATGLVVYDTTLNKLCVYTTAWETITSI